MVEVCKLTDSDIKILKELNINIEGLRVQTIIKLTELKQRVVYKRLNLLRDKGLIENVTPIWKLSNGGYQKCAKLLNSSDIFELHNISYTIQLIKKPEWWSKRRNYLIRLKEWQFKEVDFGKAHSNPYVQLKNENFVIQCYPESIIIISRKRYFSDNPYNTIKDAMDDVLNILDWFCERFKFNFFSDGIPNIQIRSNHFNRINDHLANYIKKIDGKFLIELDKRRKVWVDMSEPFGKESNYPEAQEKLEKVTKDILTKQSYLPSEVTNMIGQVTQNQLMFNSNFESHVEAIKTLSNSVRELTEQVKSLQEENKLLRKKK